MIINGIKIIGRVKHRALKKLSVVSEGEWYFVDYSDIEVKKGTVMMYEGNQILIDIILDQFGNELESIPIGWKTICRIWVVGLKLPYLDGWATNK